ncbi:MAG: HNH endonuclease family protein [Actinomycetaceae bacterium]|nr:HNH endonuclease family protein [Actinomycetaceae bacterium]
MRKRTADIVISMVIIAVGLWMVTALAPGAFRLLVGSHLEDVPASSVRDDLALLVVRAEHRAPHYERSRFGKAWADEDRNGCDTRNDVLGRDLRRVTYRSGFPPDCVVASGVLNDPYTGLTIDFVRGPRTSEAVQIDHVVALFDAWKSGAYAWDDAKRQQFANDPANLLAVDGQANHDKGHGRADEWLPKNPDYHCAYVARQVRVKAAWSLTVTETERQAMIDVLADCPAME